MDDLIRRFLKPGTRIEVKESSDVGSHLVIGSWGNWTKVQLSRSPKVFIVEVAVYIWRRFFKTPSMGQICH